MAAIERKVVQVAICGTQENGQTQAEAILVALADGGSMWFMTNREMRSDLPTWEQLPGVPVRRRDIPF